MSQSDHKHPSVVTICHLSDTHGLHRQLEHIPKADILIHTGDFTNRGRRDEFAEFNAWLGELRARALFRAIVVILGNHEWKLVLSPDRSQDAADQNARCRQEDYLPELQALLSNATHVLEHQVVDIFGLRIFGSAWCPWSRAEDPDCTGQGAHAAAAKQRWLDAGHVNGHRFDEIPEGIDILMTHGPPLGIFDRMELSSQSWGGSAALRRQIEIVRPKVHLFGHLHEQRGCWFRPPSGGGYCGGVEYKLSDSYEWPPPSENYPCQIISCNAMKNHPSLENRPAYLAGRPRLLAAEQTDTGWSFRVQGMEEDAETNEDKQHSQGSGREGPLLVVSDLHGNLDLLKQALTRGVHEAGRDDLTVVLLGDYVDNGPQIVELLEYLATEAWAESWPNMQVFTRYINMIYIFIYIYVEHDE